nr:hypothetical protein [Rhizobium sullae]
MASLNIWVPQVGQKRRRIIWPLSATLAYSESSPLIAISPLAKTTLMEALPQERYWQSLHQQARLRIGALDTSNWAAPQKHRPVIGFLVILHLICLLKVYIVREHGHVHAVIKMVPARFCETDGKLRPYRSVKQA